MTSEAVGALADPIVYIAGGQMVPELFDLLPRMQRLVYLGLAAETPHVVLFSTDHVSWSEDRKTDPNMLKNASGIPGLEVLYGLLLKGLDQRGLPLTHAARLLSLNPAALFRITHVKGALEPRNPKSYDL